MSRFPFWILVVRVFCACTYDSWRGENTETIFNDELQVSRRVATCPCPRYDSFFTGDGLWRPPLCPITQTTTTSTTSTTTTSSTTTSTTTTSTTFTTSSNESNISNETFNTSLFNTTTATLITNTSTFTTLNSSEYRLNVTTTTSTTTTTTFTTSTLTSTNTSTLTTTTSTSTSTCHCFLTPPECPNVSNVSHITDLSGCAIPLENLTEASYVDINVTANFSNETFICACFDLLPEEIKTNTTTSTSTTTSTTSTNTTTTSTRTSTTTTITTTTSTTTTTTSSTSTTTTTTSSSTTTSSTTSTTTTTIRGLACAPPCALYPRVRCKNAIEASQSCSTSTVNTACVVQGSYTFDCPYGNDDPLRSPSLRGNDTNFRIRCRVCGISQQLNDTDPREGFIAGSISFGQNAVDGYVDETPILSYAVYFVNGCGLTLGSPVATVTKISGTPDYCCLRDAYVVQISLQIPPTAQGFVIVPVTDTGPLPAGELTDTFIDLTTTTTTTTVLRLTDSAQHPTRPSTWRASATFVAAAGLVAFRL